MQHPIFMLKSTEKERVLVKTRKIYLSEKEKYGKSEKILLNK